MLSKKSQYAFKALSYLVEKRNDGPVLISEIADRKKIPLKFLENICPYFGNSLQRSQQISQLSNKLSLQKFFADLSVKFLLTKQIFANLSSYLMSSFLSKYLTMFPLLAFC